MQGSYHILTLPAGKWVTTNVQPATHEWAGRPGPPGLSWLHNPTLPAFGWMSDSSVLVEGHFVPPASRSPSGPKIGSGMDYLISLDGCHMHFNAWQMSSCWLRDVNQRHSSRMHARASYDFHGMPRFVFRSPAAVHAWSSTDHVLGLVWAHGHPSLFQAHSAMIALLSSQVDSKIGLAFQPCDGLEMSPCGRIIIAAPPPPTPDAPYQQQFCTQLIWDEQCQQMVRHETKLPDWKRFAWHPAANSQPYFVMAREKNDILLVDAKHPDNFKRWRYNDFYGLPAETRHICLDADGWDVVSWSPDGTKLVFVAHQCATIVEFNVPKLTTPEIPAAKPRVWRGMRTKFQNLFSSRS